VAVENFGNIVTSSDSGVSWTNRTSAGERNWNSVASSSDGAKLVAVSTTSTGLPGSPGGSIFTSSDFGATWTEQASAGKRWWASVTSNSDGTKLAATVMASAQIVGTGSAMKKVIVGTLIFTSSNSGITWTAQNGSSAQNWGAIASSSDGTHLAAAVLNGDIFTSSDSGVTWIDQPKSGNHMWTSLASSADGTHLIATVDNGPGGDIFTSSDSGVTWTDQVSAGSRYWYGVTSDASGKKLAAIENSGYIYTSSDFGVTWSARKSVGEQGWNAIASSSDGSKLAAVPHSGNEGATMPIADVWTSLDSGATWTDRKSSSTR
jgi:hypothetical protein